MIEFPFDTARAVTDLALTGVLTRHPEIRFVVTHAGGVLELLGGRLDRFQHTYATTSDEVPSVTSQLGELWYDEPLAGTDRLLYGSDFPFTPAEAVRAPVAGDQTTQNALRLLAAPVCAK